MYFLKLEYLCDEKLNVDSYVRTYDVIIFVFFVKSGLKILNHHASPLKKSADFKEKYIYSLHKTDPSIIISIYIFLLRDTNIYVCIILLIPSFH